MFGFSTISERRKGYSPLLNQKKAFYFFYVVGFWSDCNFRIINSRPVRHFNVLLPIHREKRPLVQKPLVRDSLLSPVQTRRCLNLATYNYFGVISEKEENDYVPVLQKWGTSFCGKMDGSSSTLLKELEKAVAGFVGKEDAIIISQGFSTNSTIIPILGQKGTLFLIDCKNHCSTITGLRSNSAIYKRWKHNNVKDLEKKIKENIYYGQTGDRSNFVPWERIIVIFEGIYSMEGQYCPLPELVELKKKYKIILYMDEAHSIGGRGVCEYFGIDPKEVDILMGTFTKSFCSFGGYICGDRDFIEYLKGKSPGGLYGNVILPPCAQKVITYINVISGKDGTNIGKENLGKLKENSIQLYDGLKDLGFEVLGERGSHVICVLVYLYSRITTCTRTTLDKGLAICCAPYPAVSFFENRIRFCVNSNLTKDDIDKTLKVMDYVGDISGTKYELPFWKQAYKFVYRRYFCKFDAVDLDQ